MYVSVCVLSTPFLAAKMYTPYLAAKILFIVYIVRILVE